MPRQFPSIQSFFQPTSDNTSRIDARPESESHQATSTPHTTADSSSPQPASIVPGDGFTAPELAHATTTRSSGSKPWQPPQQYEECEIGDLVPGPGCRTVMGRVANLFDRQHASKGPRAAKGCVTLTIKDDSGALRVRLWYATTPPALRLGQLVTLYTPHVSASALASVGGGGFATPGAAPLFASVFPGRDRACHLMVHEHSDAHVLCKTPLGYRAGTVLEGSMTLRAFVDGGYDVGGAKILVVVKYIGARKSVVSKKGEARELVNVGLFDDTAEAVLTLWGSTAGSVVGWQAGRTVLLIEAPGWRRFESKMNLSLAGGTMIDVDPVMEDAMWLRGWAEKLTRRQHCNPEFPSDGKSRMVVLFNSIMIADRVAVFDFETAMSSSLKIQYTLADLDDFARAGVANADKFVGYMSVIIMELNLVSNQRRSTLMCNECCGIPVYANATAAKCKQCDVQVVLRPNPRIVGALVDETGTTATGELILSTRAWDQLLDRTADQLVAMRCEELDSLEQHLLFRRVTLVFGWAAEDVKGNVGRMCVWEIRL